MFETTIRVVGGILTAHELSGDEAFLRRSPPACLTMEGVKIFVGVVGVGSGFQVSQVPQHTSQKQDRTWKQPRMVGSRLQWCLWSLAHQSNRVSQGRRKQPWMTQGCGASFNKQVLCVCMSMCPAAGLIRA